MSSKFLTFAACLLCVSFARATAVPMTSDADFGRSLDTIMSAASDGHYKLVEKQAKQTLDILKTLRDYADQVKGGSEKLRKEMLDHHYQDWVNTRLTPQIFEASSTNETVHNTLDLEKKNVDSDLKTAKNTGDFDSIDKDLARISSFEADYEGRVKAVEAKIGGVRHEYEQHYGNANAALAQFNQNALVQELLAAKPKLVKKIELVPANLRPLQWQIQLTKEQKDSNDPRFGHLPKTVSLPDGSASYSIVIH
jgi:hypothetical protein